MLPWSCKDVSLIKINEFAFVFGHWSFRVRIAAIVRQSQPWQHQLLSEQPEGGSLSTLLFLRCWPFRPLSFTGAAMRYRVESSGMLIIGSWELTGFALWTSKGYMLWDWIRWLLNKVADYGPCCDTPLTRASSSIVRVRVSWHMHDGLGRVHF